MVGQDRLMNVLPTLVQVPDLGFCFALPIPRDEGDNFGVFMAPTLDSYLIVTNPELNAKLADTFFSSSAILKYYALQEMVSAQLMLKNRLESRFRDAALQKYPEMKNNVETVKKPLLYSTNSGLQLVSMI